MKSVVNITPTIAIVTRTSNRFDMTKYLAVVLNALLVIGKSNGISNAASVAPSLPLPAAMPWPVVLNLVGNTSVGSMNVVTFGPTLVKN